MKKYLGVVSILIAVTTFIILQLLTGKVSGYMGMVILVLGATLSILTAAFSTRTWRKILLTGYTLIFLIFVVVSIFFGIAHM